jgi:two-component system sensor histidine kinase VicK
LDESQRRRFLGVIDQHSDRLSHLINDLLDLSRLESGEVEAHKVPLSLGRLIRTVAAQLEVQAREKRVMVHVDVSPGLPVLMANSSLMTSLVKNLLSNAIKFSHEGGEVRVEVWEDEASMVLRVSDEGIGIPAEDLPNLFEKFYRSWSAEAAGIRGTGLGLVLSKQAAEAHGGTIDVESEEGVGTRFTVQLPIEANGVPASEVFAAPSTAQEELKMRQAEPLWGVTQERSVRQYRQGART